MKKLAMLAVLMAVSGSAFAGGYDPCRSLAYQVCSEKMKSKVIGGGPNGSDVCRVTNPRSEAFLACEETERERCKRGEDMSYTVNPNC